MSIDWTKNFDKYKGLWVTLERDEKTVISSGKTLKDALEKTKKMGIKESTVFRVPTEIMPYIGFCQF